MERRPILSHICANIHEDIGAAIVADSLILLQQVSHIERELMEQFGAFERRSSEVVVANFEDIRHIRAAVDRVKGGMKEVNKRAGPAREEAQKLGY